MEFGFSAGTCHFYLPIEHFHEQIVKTVFGEAAIVAQKKEQFDVGIEQIIMFLQC